MNDPNCASVRMPGIREQLDRLNTLLSEALTIENSICGDEPVVEKLAEPSSDILLSRIEFGLDLAIARANHIVIQLHRIEERL